MNHREIPLETFTSSFYLLDMISEISISFIIIHKKFEMYSNNHEPRYTTKTSLMISLLNTLEKLRFCCNNAKQQIYARTTKALVEESMHPSNTTESSTLTKLQAMYKVNF